MSDSKRLAHSKLRNFKFNRQTFKLEIARVNDSHFIKLNPLAAAAGYGKKTNAVSVCDHFLDESNSISAVSPVTGKRSIFVTPDAIRSWLGRRSIQPLAKPCLAALEKQILCKLSPIQAQYEPDSIFQEPIELQYEDAPIIAEVKQSPSDIDDATFNLLAAILDHTVAINNLLRDFIESH